MSRPDLEAIRARCEAATPGPWTIEQFDGWRVLNADDEVVFDDGSASGEYAAACKPNNRDFFIAARADIPALLAYIELLTRERDEARAEAETWKRSSKCLRERNWPDSFCQTITSMERELSDAYEQLAKMRSLSKPWEGDAYRRGAEAMREACARVVEDADDGAPLQMLADDGIRALRIPEEP